MNTVWAIENVIDGYFMPQGFFDSKDEATTVVNTINTVVGNQQIRWRVSEHKIWSSVSDFISTDTSHIAKYLRTHTDPEYAEYQRLEAKFKGIFK